ncbi:LysM peptidoglycan-binding domain-containing protein [Dyadobacter sp. NIV53]|uniref:LysM peptidoglycan-binding domain-containing protein n=1 Tax=Dyadobacter sp. NIV53 TaxID=2861765 RepID=UPI001C86C029|nr:LysM peptidoglycan-binding domain-containing protein [Dyadobacter sp. NIV53]
MTRKFIKNIKITSFTCFLLISVIATAHAQNTSDIPASVSFGGITVKFDRSAQNLIEEDIKSLMSNKKFWEEKMERAILYFPIVEGILMDEEVPIDFKYLAVQESSFKPDVVSSSNAVGYWQFKPETARELNLRVDDEVDERKNISSSTHAAAWYLKKNNQQFNNWVSSLYSYYQGAGGVKKIVPANWSYAKEVTLTGKTDRYMLRFFAHKIALEAGIEKYRSNNKIILLESEYGKGQSFDEIARSLGINSKELESYNRWVTDGRIPTDREYLITVPVPLDQVASVREKLSLPATASTSVVATVYDENGFPVLKRSNVQSKDKNAPVLYDINGLPGIEARAGDDPKALAKAGNIRAPKFMRYNDMLKDTPLVPGHVYYLAKKNKKASTPFHTAKPGDTWQTVSQQYGLRLVNLLKYNRIISRNYPIQTGQVLWLNKKRPRKQPVEIIKPEVKPASPAQNNTEVTAANPVKEAPAAAVTTPLGRKKYTPVLVEKSESSIAKDNQDFKPDATPKATTSAIADKAVTTPRETNDRVVIITQDNVEDGSFKSADDITPSKRKSDGSANAKTKPATSSTPVSSGSVYARQQREAAEKEAAEKPVIEKVSDPVVKKEMKESEMESFHTVVAGENYYSIARKYGMNASDLIYLNRESKKGLVVGQRLRVKGNAADNEAATKLAENKRKETAGSFSPTGFTRTEKEAAQIVNDRNTHGNEGAEFHTVQAGQTYYSISRLYGISLQELMTLNDLSPSQRLISGQKLRVKKGGSNVDENPDRGSVRSSSSGSHTHTVSAGESLYRIAQKYGTTIEELKRLNNISENSVTIGQKLKVPQK